MKKAARDCVLRNLRVARRMDPLIDMGAERLLCRITAELQVDISKNEITRIDSAWYITHAGLLAIAERRGCFGIQVSPLSEFCDPVRARWVVRATVFPTASSVGFQGLGDASPATVSETMRGTEMRIAETRAVNRAIRKAYSVALCSVEELAGRNKIKPTQTMREQLNDIGKRYRLDREGVRAYAREYCGVRSLAQATEPQVISFLHHLKRALIEDPAKIRCLLSGYGSAKPPKTTPSPTPSSNSIQASL